MSSRSAINFTPIPLMLVIAACVFSVDVYIPSMPAMLQDFGTTQEIMQFSISAGIIGTSLVTPIIGPFSDAIGRRKILLYSQVLYMLGCIITIFATNIEMFIICRFIQGIGGAAAFAAGFAVITDLYQGTRAAVYLSYLTTTITLSLVIAPLFGGAFAAYFPWQAAFVFLSTLAALSVLVLFWRLPETLQNPTPFSIKKTLSSYGSMLSHKRFMVMAVVPSLMIGGMLAFMATGAFYFINELGVPAYFYGICQGIVMICNTLSSYLSGYLIQRFGFDKTTLLGVTLFGIGSILFSSIALFAPEQTVWIVISISLYASGLGMTFNTMTAQSMALFRQTAGAVSSIISFMRGLIISACISIGSQIYNGSLWPTAIFLTAIAAICISSYYLVVRRKSLEDDNKELCSVG